MKERSASMCGLVVLLATGIQAVAASVVITTATGGGADAAAMFHANNDRNFGSATAFYYEGVGHVVGYYRFDLSSVAGTITAATFKLTTTAGDNVGDRPAPMYMLADGNDGWTEGTGGDFWGGTTATGSDLCQTNRPSDIDRTSLGTWTISANAAGQTLSFSSAALVAALNTPGADKMVTLVMETPDNWWGNTLRAATKENGTYAAPTLDLEVGGAVSAPTVVADPTSASVQDTTATLGGQVTSTGGAAVTERGIYWSTASGFTPPGQGTKVAETGTFGVGSYTRAVTGLPAGNTVYFRSFAVNEAGTTYSANQGTILTKLAGVTTVEITTATGSGADAAAMYHAFNDSNFGSATVFYQEGDGHVNGYYRFDLSGIKGTITAASFRLTSTTTESIDHRNMTVYMLADGHDGWGEGTGGEFWAGTTDTSGTTLTRNNLPSNVGRASLGTWVIVSPAAGDTLSFSSAALLEALNEPGADRLVTIVTENPDNWWGSTLRAATKENATYAAPTLLLEVTPLPAAATVLIVR